jgi:[ribosomal protein S5]-alanine N-acetyltransferase
MTIALDKIIDLAFVKLGLEVLEAFTHRENIKSRKLLERFKFEEVIGKIDSRNRDNMIYTLTRSHV